jgi:nucleotide-binding universal stress UspA family protein
MGGRTLLKQAQYVHADLLVMGAYGHSQLQERIFGGATRYVLGHAEVPVLMHH